MIINNLGIYVHIPFCAVKCPYCDFYSCKYSKQLESDYVQAVIKDILRWKNKGYTADTLYFGGGTPSIISPESIGDIIDTVKMVFGSCSEVTMEANPRMISAEKIKKLSEYGVNRISLGMQSAVKKELTALGRTHTFDDVKKAVDIIKHGGISNISLDLMLATPYQTANSLNESIKSIATLDVQHVSAYILKIEENTPYYTDDIVTNCPDEEQTCELYLQAVNELATVGFNQYEISNFCKPGFESKHNLKYWLGNMYLGFGPAAHSLFNKKRYCYAPSLQDYINSPKWICTDTVCSDYEEYVMLNLRLSSGIDLAYIYEKFGVDMAKLIQIANPLENGGLLIVEGNKVRLTPQGFLVSNAIIQEFLI